MQVGLTHFLIVSGILFSLGIYGIVTRVLEDRFEIEVDKGTKLQIAKGSISSVIQPDSGQKK